MKIGFSVRKSGGNIRRTNLCALAMLLAALGDFSGVMGAASAQSNPYSSYIPVAVPTATSTLFTNGSTAISPGRVGVDKLGNTFYVAHVSGSASALYEIPNTGIAGTTNSPTPLITGLGQVNSNSVFVDAAGALWVSNGNGTGGSLIEIPAVDGVPNVAAITGNSNYGSTGLPMTNVTDTCSATSTAPCTWSASSIESNLTALQIADIYSDGAGNVYLVDLADSVSNGAYNRVVQFKTSAAGTLNVIADKLTTNAYAQVTVAGDGKIYYCDSLTGNSSGGAVSVINGGSLTAVGNTATTSLTLVNPIVKVYSSSGTGTPDATGITTDPWGSLIISGPTQLSEVPLEAGALNFLDEFNLLLASGSQAPMSSNHVVYGGTFDVHGSYYYATTTNIMQVQVNGYNFGKINVGTEVTTTAPYLNITWGLPSYLQTSLSATASPNTLSSANAAYLQSFPYGNKSYSGGTPYSASTLGQYSLMYFQPIYPGLLRGAISPQGYSNALGATDTNAAKDFYMSGAYLANLQGVGVGPHPMFLPGVASKAVTLSQLYTSYSKAAKAVGFTPMGVAVDSFGDIFVADTTNTSLDLDCLASTANTAQNYRAAAAGANSGPGYANSYCLTDGLADTNGINFAGLTFKVSATGVSASSPNFATSFVTPVDVVLDGMNNAYVLDSGNGTAAVTKMGYATMIPSVVVPKDARVEDTPLYQPQGIALDGYGNLYIADTGNNRIIQGRLYNAAYSQNIVYISSTVTFQGSPLNGPTGLGLDASGNLFIADTGNKRIVEYSVTGVTSVVSPNGVSLVSPTGVKVLPSGALVVADSTLGLVLIDNGVASVLSTGSIKLSSTAGLALDQMGNIYVADPTGGQVVELNTNSPTAATQFPDTLKPDSSGNHTNSETSYIYNIGNTPLILGATPIPTVVDNTSSAINEFSIDSNNGCIANTTLAPDESCSMVMDFTPSSTAAVYTTVTGTATVADNLASYTLIPNPATSAEAIGSFGTAGSTQTVNLSGNPVVPFTAQTITFTPPAPVNWSASIPSIQLVATGGPSGKPVVFSIVSGTGTLSGPNNSILTVKDIGTTVIAANQAGAQGTDGVYYSAAPQVTAAMVVNPIGTVATPTFSVPAGTYTAAQSVTISDSTPGATIYYTTNGNTPTASSPVYSGTAIPVTVTTTIKAIAIGAPGYLTSSVASATYTLNPDFTLTPYVASFTVPNGLKGSTTLSLTPLFGFTGTVTLSCSSLNSGDACSFLDASNNPTTTLTTTNGNSAYGTLLIQANETASLSKEMKPLGPISVLALAIAFFRKRKRLAMVLVLLFGALGASMMTGCSDPSTTGKSHTSTFTLTATSGSIVHSTTITLDVNNLK